MKPAPAQVRDPGASWMPRPGMRSTRGFEDDDHAPIVMQGIDKYIYIHINVMYYDISSYNIYIYTQ